MNIDNAAWRKSSYSAGTETGECVEVAPLDARAGVRDTKDRSRGHLEIPSDSWTVLLAAIKI